MQFRRFAFTQPYAGPLEVLCTVAPEIAHATLTLYPLTPQVANATLTLRQEHGAWVVTRRVHIQDSVSALYRPWHVQTEHPQSLWSAFLSGHDMRLGLRDPSQGILVLGDLHRDLRAHQGKDTAAVGDPRQWSQDTDLHLQVRLGDYTRALRTLRGPGRHVRSDLRADLILHGALPLDLREEGPMTLRVITAQRLDSDMTRSDFVGVCTPRLVETVGVRFDLVPALQTLDAVCQVLGHGKACEGPGPIVQLGFEPQLNAAWLGQIGEDCTWVRWHTNSGVQVHASAPHQTTLPEPDKSSSQPHSLSSGALL